MHEFSLGQEILKIAENSARREGVRIIKKITLHIGTLSGVQTESLMFALEILSRQNNLFTNCVFIVEQKPAILNCRQCGHNKKMAEEFDFSCSRCSSTDTDMISGRELHLASIEAD